LLATSCHAPNSQHPTPPHCTCRYASQTADFTENQLQNSIFTFYNEFKAKTNINLAQLMQVGEKTWIPLEDLR